MTSTLSARTRITLGSVAVAAVLLALGLGLVRGQVESILSEADLSLARSDLVSFEKDVTAHPDEAVDDPGTGVLVLVLGPDGSVQVDTLPHDVQERVEHVPAGDHEFRMTDDEGRTFVVVGRAVATTAGDWMLWSARSTSASELALRGFDTLLISGGLVLLGGLSLASWVIATLALRPVERARARERQMVSDAAHELRTPLAALTTQLELAHADFDDPRALEGHVRSAEASVTRLAGLAGNLLELSRLDAASAPPSPTRAAGLADAFMASIDRARMLAHDRSLSIDFDVALDDDSAAYRMSAQSLERLVDNLLANALDAVEDDGTIAAVLTQSSGSLVLTVSDDGHGMPEDFIPVAFERFTRPDSARTTGLGGSGLGLALVAAIVREAGGTVRLENTHPGLRVVAQFPKM